MRSDVIFAAVQCLYIECKSHTYICYYIAASSNLVPLNWLECASSRALSFPRLVDANHRVYSLGWFVRLRRGFRLAAKSFDISLCRGIYIYVIKQTIACFLKWYSMLMSNIDIVRIKHWESTIRIYWRSEWGASEEISAGVIVFCESVIWLLLFLINRKSFEVRNLEIRLYLCEGDLEGRIQEQYSLWGISCGIPRRFHGKELRGNILLMNSEWKGYIARTK